MGRPSLLNDQLIAEFCDALRVSGSIESAIIMSGIGRSTYYRLRGKVRESGGNEQQRRFFQAVHKAESQIKMMREHQLSKHFEKDWRAITSMDAAARRRQSRHPRHRSNGRRGARTRILAPGTPLCGTVGNVPGRAVRLAEAVSREPRPVQRVFRPCGFGQNRRPCAGRR